MREQAEWRGGPLGHEGVDQRARGDVQQHEQGHEAENGAHAQERQAATAHALALGVLVAEGPPVEPGTGAVARPPWRRAPEGRGLALRAERERVVAHDPQDEPDGDEHEQLDRAEQQDA
jgi:hypothetical protein